MPPVQWVSVITAAAPYVHLAEPADQVNDPLLSPVPSLLVVTAAAPAESFPFKPVAQVDKPALSFAPSAASVDSTAVSVAGSPPAPSVNAVGYVDVMLMWLDPLFMVIFSHVLQLLPLSPPMIMNLPRIPRM